MVSKRVFIFIKLSNLFPTHLESQQMRLMHDELYLANRPSTEERSAEYISALALSFLSIEYSQPIFTLYSHCTLRFSGKLHSRSNNWVEHGGVASFTLRKSGFWRNLPTWTLPLILLDFCCSRRKGGREEICRCSKESQPWSSSRPSEDVRQSVQLEIEN